MAWEEPRCPRCDASFPRGTTVCPACHAALDLGHDPSAERPSALIFETWDRSSADTVSRLLEARGVPCLLRGTAERLATGLGPPGFWRIYVRAPDEARAQAILDEEIGREEA